MANWLNGKVIENRRINEYLTSLIIDVELGAERFRARVSELDASEAARRREIQAERSEQFGAYLTSAAPRTVPVFTITRL